MALDYLPLRGAAPPLWRRRLRFLRAASALITHDKVFLSVAKSLHPGLRELRPGSQNRNMLW